MPILARTLIPTLVALAATASLGSPAQAAEPKPTRISKMVRGTNLKAEPSVTRAPANPLCSANAWQSMRDFRTTGGTSVSLVIPLLQTSMKSSVITRRADTPSDTCLREAIRHGRAAGLAVNLKPLLEVRECVRVPMKKGGWFISCWRGRVDPTDRKQWNGQWAYWISHYGVIARQEHAQSLTIGTEMPGVTKGNQRFWIGLVKELHKKQKARGVRIGYAANRTGEVGDLSKKFVRSLDEFGVTFYPALDLKGAASEAKIVKALGSYTKNLRATSKRFDRKLHIYEFGVRSRRGTLAQTSDGTPGKSSVVDLEVQRMGYEAMLRYFNGLSMVKGIHSWQTDTDPDAGGPGRSDYTVQNKPAEAVQAKWFGGKVER